MSKLYIKKLLDDTVNKGMERPIRVVSYKEYKVLEKMASEWKLDMSGFPKFDFIDEYFKLMKEWCNNV